MASITIASFTIPDWQGNSSGVTLRIYNNEAFTTPGSTHHPKTVVPQGNRPSVGGFYRELTCTVSSGALTIPSFTIDSTTDSTDNPGATYTAVLWDSQSGTPIHTFGTFASFSLNSTPTSTTWPNIWAVASDV